MLKPPHVVSHIHTFYFTEVWDPRKCRKVLTEHNCVQTIYHHKLLVTYFYWTAFFYPLAVTNNTTMANAPSDDDLQASFTFSLFNPIVVKPYYETLFKLETQETRNAATVTIRLPPPHKTFLASSNSPRSTYYGSEHLPHDRHILEMQQIFL